MKNHILRLTLWSLLFSTIQTAWADGCETASSTDRFDVNADGTVTELHTGLTWMRCAVGQQWDGADCKGDAQLLTWFEANKFVDELNEQGGVDSLTDWRLPKLNEIATISERRCGPPRINLAVFPNTAPQFFWTSNNTPGNAEYAYTFSFGAQGVDSSAKSSSCHVRLVRGRD